jgi:flagellin
MGLNISALKTQQKLDKNVQESSRIAERLSSGMRITDPSDDAAGLSIISSLSADTRVYNRARLNISDATSAVTIADGALTSLTEIVTRIAELAEQAANGTLGRTQRQALDREGKELVKEYNRIVSTTTFNGVALLNPSNSRTSVQAGYGTEEMLQYSYAGSLVHGVGTGQFDAVQTIDASLHAYSIATADLNRDGFDDIIAPNSGSNTKILLSNGDGTFSQSTVAFGSAWRTEPVDINNDGILDLFSSDGQFALGNGNGTFGSVQSITGAGSAAADFLYDLDRNGTTDFIAVAGSGLVTVSYATSPGVFGVGTTTYNLTSYGLTGPFYGRATGDLNGDGYADLFFGKSVADGGGAWLAFGQTGGTFSAPTLVAALGTDAVDGDFVDFNQDGALDILVSSAGGALPTRVYFGNGNGTFRTPTSLTGTNSVSSVAKDLNGDGYLDIVSSGFLSSASKIWLNDQAGGFTLSQTLSSSSNGNHTPAVGDFNGDGAQDIVLGGYDLGFGDSGLRMHFAQKVDTTAIGVFNLSSQAAARESLDRAKTLISAISSHRGVLGATLSRLESMNRNLTSRTTEYTAAQSRIQDADIATEMSEYIRRNILSTVGASILGIATNNSIILDLLSG